MPEVITDHLDLWSSALLAKSTAGRGGNGKLEAYGIKKLRELILELAVRGKLVPQNQSDEPATELLKRVAADKAQMVKEGIVRREKDFLPIADDEIPFNLPEGWMWARINDVGHDWGQKTPDATFTYIDVSAIDNSAGVISSPTVLSPSDAPSRARKIVQRGTVIYSTVRPYLKNICVIEEDYEPQPIASTAFAILHPLQGMPGRFFAFYFRSPEFVRYVELVQTGIAYPAINDKQFYGGLVPIPPLAEQHRIVAKVDELMALCDQLEQQQTDSLAAHQTMVETLLGTLTRVESQQEFSAAWARIPSHFDTLFTTQASIDQLKQTILQLAVMGKLVPQDPNDEPASVLLGKVTTERARRSNEGKVNKAKSLAEIIEDEKPYALPHGWVWVRVGTIFNVTSGNTFDARFEKELASIAYVKVGDMNLPGNELVITTSSRFIDPDEKAKDWIIPTGSIIFPKRGGAIATNKKRIVGRPIFVDLNTMAITPASGEVEMRYAYIWLLTIDLAALNTGTSVPQINHKDIDPLIFPLPPGTEQRRIVAKVDELMALCDALKARLADAQTTQLHLADAIVEQTVC